MTHPDDTPTRPAAPQPDESPDPGGDSSSRRGRGRRERRRNRAGKALRVIGKAIMMAVDLLRVARDVRRR
jgi:hypothetical protein